MYIKGQTNAKRCEICHQADKYDEGKGQCSRCYKLKNSSKKVYNIFTSISKEFIGKLVQTLVVFVILICLTVLTKTHDDFGMIDLPKPSINYRESLLGMFYGLVLGVFIGGVIFTPIFLVSNFSTLVKHFGFKDLQKLLNRLTK